MTERQKLACTGAELRVGDIRIGFGHRDAAARILAIEVLPDGRRVVTVNFAYEDRHLAGLDIVIAPDERCRILRLAQSKSK